MKTIIINGSSKPKGNTFKMVERLKEQLEADVLDLTTKNIQAFDYTFENQNDDFNQTMHHLLDHYDNIIFATPVYWYTMSGLLKNFIDRFTDGLLHDKALGRKFENKSMAALACGSSKEPIEGFFIPFQKTAVYLKMNYLGDVHLWEEEGSNSEKEIQKRVHSFTVLFQ